MPSNISSRVLGLLVLAFGASGCATAGAGASANAATAPPTYVASPAVLRNPEFALPFHAAAIVDLALLPAQAGEQWRLASGDAEGWVRIWADGKLLAAWQAHPGGLAALVMAEDGAWFTAGFDGRVLEWSPASLTPIGSFALGRPITAFAVAGPHVAVSDGRHVQLWTRGPTPEHVATFVAHGFVTGLALSRSGGVIAAAELREMALRDGVATHPLAPFDDGPRALERDEQVRLRALAQHDFPGAAADYVEVWQPSQDRSRHIEPQAPIDSDLALLQRGGVVYREIYGRDNAGLIGRRLQDTAHVPLEMIKPWSFWTKADGNPTEASFPNPNLPAGDFRLGPADEILVLDLFPGWGSEPEAKRGWRVGDHRELAIDPGYAALGDGQGNLAVVGWVHPAETGWQAPGEERPDLLAAAPNSPSFVTAVLEPRSQYRLWSLAEGGQRSVRVEAPWHVVPPTDAGPREADPAAGVALYPFMLAVDGEANFVVTSLASYAGDQQAAVRVLRVVDGAAQILSLVNAETPLDLGVSPDAAHVLAWAPGAAARSWQSPSEASGWTPGPDALGGAPRFSPSGRYSAHVSGLERNIVDLDAHTPVVTLAAETVSQDLGAGTLAAIADDGTLALVQPFGGGTLERIDLAGQRTTLELPGAATALAWVTPAAPETAPETAPEGAPETPASPAPVLLVGFEDGSIVRIDGDNQRPIHAGQGGRIWGLAALGARPGVFIELDERGLTVHRLSDDASLELTFGDRNALSRWDASPVEALHANDLVAVWRPGTAMPPCRILDGTAAGVLTRSQVERWPAERAAELFEAFFGGQGCAVASADNDGASETAGDTGPDTAEQPKPEPAPSPSP